MNCKETKIFFQPVFFRFFQINFNQSFSAKTQIKIYFSAASKTAYSTQKNAMTQCGTQTRGTILVSGSVRSHVRGAPLCGGSEVPRALQDIFYDPQTSGGLLMALPEEAAAECLAELQKSIPQAREIGYVTEKMDADIYLE